MTPEEAARFIPNVIEARENGYEEVCAECGVGIYDDTDMHERGCSRWVDPFAGPSKEPTPDA